MRDEPDDGLPPEEASLRDRIAAFARTAAALLATRSELFRAELAAKGPPLWRGLALLVAAAAFLFSSILMLTALAAVLLAELTGSATLGLAIVLVLYLALAAAAAFLGAKSLSRVEPLKFPVTAAEIRRDLEEVFPPGVEEAALPPRAPDREPGEPEPDPQLEDRFRMGSE